MKIQIFVSDNKIDWVPALDNHEKEIIVDTEKLEDSIINMDENYEICIKYTYIKFVKYDKI